MKQFAFYRFLLYTFMILGAKYTNATLKGICMNKKLIILLISTAMVLPNLAFINTHIGVNLSNGNHKPTVFREVFVNDSELASNDMTRDEFMEDITLRAQKSWSFSIIDDYVDKIHYVGGHFESEPLLKAQISDNIALASNADAKYIYTVKNKLGSKIITVQIKPNTKQSMQLLSYLLDYGKGSDDEYIFIINTPNKIKSSNGTVSTDKMSVCWDIKDALINETEMELVVEYSNPISYVICFVVILAIAGALITFILLRRKKASLEYCDYDAPSLSEFYGSKKAEKTESDNKPLNNDKSNNSSNNDEPAIKKCPNCGAKLTADETFCENCGTFI